MAEASTTNLLTATNRVLRDIGERGVLNLSSPVSLKASSFLADAVRTLGSEHDWEWSRDRIGASTWLNERADLGDVQRIVSVTYGDTTGGYWPVDWVDNEDFDLRSLTSFVGTTSGLRPYVWTAATYNIIRLNPYPSDLTGQGNTVFYVVRDLPPPTLASDTFPVPERYMFCLYKQACAQMAMKHLDDPNLAQIYLAEYKELVNKLRAREQSTPARGFNMYRSYKLPRRVY